MSKVTGGRGPPVSPAGGVARRRVGPPGRVSPLDTFSGPAGARIFLPSPARPGAPRAAPGPAWEGAWRGPGRAPRGPRILPIFGPARRPEKRPDPGAPPGGKIPNFPEISEKVHILLGI